MADFFLPWSASQADSELQVSRKHLPKQYGVVWVAVGISVLCGAAAAGVAMRMKTKSWHHFAEAGACGVGVLVRSRANNRACYQFWDLDAFRGVF